MTLSPFVAKRNTPLDGADFSGVDVINRRINQLKKALRGRIDLRSTSAKWAWVEYCLAQGGFEMANVTIEARKKGGSFGAWRGAVKRHAPHFMGSLHSKKDAPSGTETQ